MKKNTARIMYLLGIVMAVMALSSLLGITTSAGNYTITRYVGIKYSLPKVTAENDYGPPFNSYSFSDLSMVLIDGKPITKTPAYADFKPFCLKKHNPEPFSQKRDGSSVFLQKTGGEKYNDRDCFGYAERVVCETARTRDTPGAG